MSRRSGIRFADKDMRRHKNLWRFPSYYGEHSQGLCLPCVWIWRTTAWKTASQTRSSFIALNCRLIVQYARRNADFDFQPAWKSGSGHIDTCSDGISSDAIFERRDKQIGRPRPRHLIQGSRDHVCEGAAPFIGRITAAAPQNQTSKRASAQLWTKTDIGKSKVQSSKSLVLRIRP
jgi:hypothetical protein